MHRSLDLYFADVGPYWLRCLSDSQSFLVNAIPELVEVIYRYKAHCRSCFRKSRVDRPRHEIASCPCTPLDPSEASFERQGVSSYRGHG